MDYICLHTIAYVRIFKDFFLIYLNINGSYISGQKGISGYFAFLYPVVRLWLCASYCLLLLLVPCIVGRSYNNAIHPSMRSCCGLSWHVVLCRLGHILETLYTSIFPSYLHILRCQQVPAQKSSAFYRYIMSRVCTHSSATDSIVTIRVR